MLENITIVSLAILSFPDISILLTISEFNSFNKRNPSVYTKLLEISLRLKKVGASKYGMKALFEILRFNALLQSDSKFELNNSYAPYYARLLMKNEPLLDGFFRIRTLTSTTK